MLRLTDRGVFLNPEFRLVENPKVSPRDAETRTISYRILKAHNQSGDMKNLRLKFDTLVSPDNNYVSILQTARASGLKRFPVPYVLSNCHHSLCAVGGTINEDDHIFGLDCAKKYGGIFVPPYCAVLHQYMREKMAGCGMMILGSDSHTRYGALGTMGIGEGGGEIAKQLLSRTYDIARPPVIAVRMTGAPRPGVGPMDIALTVIGKTFKNGFCKNKILEFVGDGVAGLSVEFRMGVDVMMTESAALSSVWITDEKVREYLRNHGRESVYSRLCLEDTAYYDGMIDLNLSEVECMMALPFHPSNAVSIHEFQKNARKYLEEVEREGRHLKGDRGAPFSLMSHLKEDGLHIDQALVSGCSGGTFENIVAMADILKGCAIPGDGPALGINPASQPVYLDLVKKGAVNDLMVAGVTFRPAICGPCFGVTDVPADNQLSIRHMTRNYPNREGSKASQGQMAASILMDARSIAATIRGGVLTAASDLDVAYSRPGYAFEEKIYNNRVFDNYGHAEADTPLRMGPNIADWPCMMPLQKHLLLKVAGSYSGSLTTDQLTPSGEASSFRSNPNKIAEYTLINQDRGYVKRAKEIRRMDEERREGRAVSDTEAQRLLEILCRKRGCSMNEITAGSLLAAGQIGDGSSREQAASSQKVLGGWANLANEYSTKRYRSNLINWGILPLLTAEKIDCTEGEWLWLPDAAKKIMNGEALQVLRLNPDDGTPAGEIVCSVGTLTDDEKKILLSGCLINFYANEAVGRTPF